MTEITHQSATMEVILTNDEKTLDLALATTVYEVSLFSCRLQFMEGQTVRFATQSSNKIQVLQNGFDPIMVMIKRNDTCD